MRGRGGARVSEPAVTLALAREHGLADDEYDLYSLGTPGTGRIDLNYRGGPSGTEPLPPSSANLRQAGF